MLRLLCCAGECLAWWAPSLVCALPHAALLIGMLCCAALRCAAQVGAYLAWLVRALMIITGVITWPIGEPFGCTCHQWCALLVTWHTPCTVTWHATCRLHCIPVHERRRCSLLPGLHAGKLLDWTLGEESALFRWGLFCLLAVNCQHTLLPLQSCAECCCAHAAAMRPALGIGLHGRWLHGQPLRSYGPVLCPCRRHELKAFVGLHGEAHEGEMGEVPLSLDEVQVMQGMPCKCTAGSVSWRGLLCTAFSWRRCTGTAALAPLHWRHCASAAAHQPPDLGSQRHPSGLAGDPGCA